MGDQAYQVSPALNAATLNVVPLNVVPLNVAAQNVAPLNVAPLNVVLIVVRSAVLNAALIVVRSAARSVVRNAVRSAVELPCVLDGRVVMQVHYEAHYEAHYAAHYEAHYAAHSVVHFAAHCAVHCVAAVAHNAGLVVQCAALVQNGGKEFRFFHALLACAFPMAQRQTVSRAVRAALPDLVAQVAPAVHLLHLPAVLREPPKVFDRAPVRFHCCCRDSMVCLVRVLLGPDAENGHQD
jgi:hypothetical protein